MKRLAVVLTLVASMFLTGCGNEKKKEDKDAKQTTEKKEDKK